MSINSLPSDRKIFRFNLICAIVGLVGLNVLVLNKQFRFHRLGLPQAQDFPQYYMAAVMVLHGEWDSLYPIPTNPLANPGSSLNSEMRPRYAELAAERGVGNEVRFISPPPVALLLVPIALLPYWPAHLVWTVVISTCIWIISLQTGWLYDFLIGRRSRAVGWFCLFICLSPQAFRWARVGNMSIMLGVMIGIAILDLLHRRKGFRAAIPLALGTVAKYALAVLAPVYLVLGQWRTILWTGILIVLMFALTFFIFGFGPFEAFANEIAPMLKITTIPEENNALHAFFLRNFTRGDVSVLPQPWEGMFRAVQVVVLIVILTLIVLRRRMMRQSSSAILAASLALLTWIVVFSPIFFEYYHSYFAPFYGWLIWEGRKNISRMIVAILAIGMAWLPTQVIRHPPVRVVELLKSIHLAAVRSDGAFRLPEPLFSHLLFSAVLMLAFSIYVLVKDKAHEPADQA